MPVKLPSIADLHPAFPTAQPAATSLSPDQSIAAGLSYDNMLVAPVPTEPDGYIGGGLKALGRGLAEIPINIGHTLEKNTEVMQTKDPSRMTGLNRFGKAIADTSEGLKALIPEPNAGGDYVKAGVFSGIESAPVSFAYAAPSVVGSVLASAPFVAAAPATAGASLVPGLAARVAGAAGGQAMAAYPMYAATAQQTYEDVLKANPDIDPNLAYDIAHKSGLHEAGWETLGNTAEGVILGALPGGKGAKTGLGLVKQIFKPGIKQAGKQMALSAPFEVGSEWATGYNQTQEMNRALPVERQVDPIAGGNQSIVPSLVISALTGGIGGGITRLRTNSMAKQLTTPVDVAGNIDQQLEERLKLAGMVHAEAAKTLTPEQAESWRVNSLAKISNNEPIPLDESMFSLTGGQSNVTTGTVQTPNQTAQGLPRAPVVSEYPQGTASNGAQTPVAQAPVRDINVLPGANPLPDDNADIPLNPRGLAVPAPVVPAGPLSTALGKGGITGITPVDGPLNYQGLRFDPAVAGGLRQGEQPVSFSVLPDANGADNQEKLSAAQWAYSQGMRPFAGENANAFTARVIEAQRSGTTGRPVAPVLSDAVAAGLSNEIQPVPSPQSPVPALSGGPVPIYPAPQGLVYPQQQGGGLNGQKEEGRRENLLTTEAIAVGQGQKVEPAPVLSQKGPTNEVPAVQQAGSQGTPEVSDVRNSGEIASPKPNRLAAARIRFLSQKNRLNAQEHKELERLKDSVVIIRNRELAQRFQPGERVTDANGEFTGTVTRIVQTHKTDEPSVYIQFNSWPGMNGPHETFIPASEVRKTSVPALSEENKQVPVENVKQPWEMTLGEALGKRDEDVDWNQNKDPNSPEGQAHRQAVENAIAEGKPVPANVLKAYPWAEASRNIKPYVESLQGMTDDQLKVEARRTASELNKWVKTSKLQAGNVEYFEISGRFNAADKELSRRKGSLPVPSPQSPVPEVTSQAPTSPSLAGQAEPVASPVAGSAAGVASTSPQSPVPDYIPTGDDFDRMFAEEVAKMQAEQQPVPAGEPYTPPSVNRRKFRETRMQALRKKLAAAKSDAKEQKRLRQALDKLKQEAAKETATAQATPKPERDNAKEPYFHKGDRVQLTGERHGGEHGVVTNASSYVMRSPLIGFDRNQGVHTSQNREEHSHTYEVTKDNGVVISGWFRDMEHETTPAPAVVPAPVADGRKVDIVELQRMIETELAGSRSSRNAAERARKKETIAEHKQTAERRAKLAKEYQAVLDAWVEQYPAEAKRLGLGAPVAASTAVASGSAPVVAVPAMSGVAVVPGAKVTFTTYNGEPSIDIRFDGKPSDAVLADLRRYGFRWAMRQKKWYAKEEPDRRAYAEAIQEKKAPPVLAENETQPEGSSYIYGKDGDGAWYYRMESGQPGKGNTVKPSPELLDKLETALASKRQAEYDRKASSFTDSRDKHNAEATEHARLQKVGQDALPGIRFQDAADVGKVWEMKQAGTLTADEWDSYVAEMKRDGKVKAEAPPVAEKSINYSDFILKVRNYLFNNTSLQESAVKSDLQNFSIQYYSEYRKTISRVYHDLVKQGYDPKKVMEAFDSAIKNTQAMLAPWIEQYRDTAKKAAPQQPAKSAFKIGDWVMPVRDKDVLYPGHVAHIQTGGLIQIAEAGSNAHWSPDDYKRMSDEDQAYLQGATVSFSKPAAGNKVYGHYKKMVVISGNVPGFLSVDGYGDTAHEAFTRALQSWKGGRDKRKESGSVTTSVATSTPDNLAEAKRQAEIAFQEGAAAIRAILKNAANPNKLGSGIGPDDEVYQQIKPHLSAMWTAAKASVENLQEAIRDFIRRVISEIGVEVQPYARTFYEENMAQGLDSSSKAATLETKAGGEGENHDNTRNDITGTGTLETVPGSVPQNAEEQRPGTGSRSSGQVDDDGDEDSDARGIHDGSGSLASEPRPVYPEEPGEGLSTGRDGRGGRGGVESVPASEPRSLVRSGDNPGNYRITETDALGSGTPGQKISNNLAAIRLVKTLDRENRYPTRDEQAVLAKYVGWGGLKNVFNAVSNKKQEREALAELKQLLTEPELFAARQSVLNAFYTSPEVINSMYDVLRHFGFTGGYTLEPTYGSGNFIGLMPDDLAASSKWYGSELDPITAKIGQYLYPDAQLINDGFQNAEFPYAKFDVAIGNPPFGDERLTDNNKKRKEIDGFKIHNYVIAKAGMHIRPGGVMAMVVTNRFLDTANPEARDYLAKQFKFLTAIRLPNNAFAKNAGTEVTTDLVFFQRLMPGEDPRVQYQGWLDTGAEYIYNGEVIKLNQFFARNPQLMLGEPSMQGTMYGGKWREGEEGKGEFTLNARPGQDTAALITGLLQDELSHLKNIMQAQSAQQAEFTASTMQMNREDVGVGGYTLEGDTAYMRRDDDEHGNVLFEKLTPESNWNWRAWPLKTIRGIIESGDVRKRQTELLAAIETYLGVDPVTETVEEDQAEGSGKSTSKLAKLLQTVRKELSKGPSKSLGSGELKKELATAIKRAELGADKLNRIVAMLKLREQTYQLITLERADSPAMKSARASLNSAYDAFVAKYGYINDPKNAGLMADDVKIEFGLEDKYRKEISAARAKALGVKPQPARADKATILKERIFFPYKEVTSADTPRDGYSVSLSEKGRLDLDYIGELTGKSREEITDELAEAGLIFADPEQGGWIQEDVYLSGNVKSKLKQVEGRDGYERNVEALKKVIPEDVTPEQVFAGLGATWIPAEVYKDFADLMGIRGAVISVQAATGTVTIVDSNGEVNNELNVTLENQDYGMVELFNLLANKKPVVAYDRDAEGKRHVNKDRTKLLVPIAKRFAATFRDWIMADPERATELTRIYNETQNTHAQRRFDGQLLRTVGNNPAVELRNTQKNAAWRMIQSPVTLLDHVVGAGKTFTIITGAMERVRLGLSKKPMVVVPNHLVGQWAKDYLKLYPGAHILAATEKDFSSKNRRRLFSRIATGKFDAVIIGHSSLGFIPLERDTESAFIREEVAYLERALAQAEDAKDRRAMRTLTNRIAKKQERLARLMGRDRDDVATFESMGIDYLVVDESHEFKNLEYSTIMQNVAGMGTPTGAQKSFDLYSKLRYLRSKEGGVCFATGTPISNSLVEMFTLLRYLNLEGLKERNIDTFDAWAKTYSTIETLIEYTAAQKLKDRAVIMFEGNTMPEMLQLYQQFADTVSMADLKRLYAEQVREKNAATGGKEPEEFPVPEVKAGGRTLEISPPTAAQREFMDYLVARANRLERLGGQNDPKTDNALWVMSDARKMALDIRLVDTEAPSDPDNKVNRSAVEIKRIYDTWHEDKGTQLVFCDLSTPAKQAGGAARTFIGTALKALALNKDAKTKAFLEELPTYQLRWSWLKDKIDQKLEEIEAVLSGNPTDSEVRNLDKWREKLETFLEGAQEEESALLTADIGFSVYDDLKATLVQSGIPENEIRFIHEANTKDKKDELFAMVNSGEVRVLLGSSRKMGAGTNVQERIVALHHLDAPWRPADVEQREGRAIRQGNILYERDPKGFELEIKAYSTGNTFDAVMWGVLTRKAKTLEQFRTGDRSFKDVVESDSDSYATFMAESTGNPAFKEKFQLEQEIEELEGMERSTQTRRASSERIVGAAPERLRQNAENIKKAERDLDAVRDATGFVYDGQTYAEDLEQAITEAAEEHRAAMQRYWSALEGWRVKKTQAEAEAMQPWHDKNPDPGVAGDMSADEYAIFVEERDAWRKAHKKEVDKFERAYLKDNPKPKEPGEPSITKLAQKSEAAQLVKELLKRLDVAGDETLAIDVKYGKKFITFGRVTNKENSHSFSIEIQGMDKHNTLGDDRYPGAHPSEKMMLKYFRDGAIKQEFTRNVSSERRWTDSIKRTLAEAELILDKVKFEDGPKLAEKRLRYEAVVAEVNRLEEEIAARRETEENKYISRDSNRFGGEGVVRRSTGLDDNEPVDFVQGTRFANRPKPKKVKPSQVLKESDRQDWAYGYVDDVPYYSNSHVLLEGEAPDGNTGFEINANSLKTLLATPATVVVQPVGYSEIVRSKGPNTRVVWLSDGAAFNALLYDYIMQERPGAEFFTDGTGPGYTNPILVKQSDQIVGLVMPLENPDMPENIARLVTTGEARYSLKSSDQSRTLSRQALATIEAAIARILPAGSARLHTVSDIRHADPAALRAHGVTEGEVAGLHQTVQNLTTGELHSVITLALGSATEQTGYHEILHAAKALGIVTEADEKILQRVYPALKGKDTQERQADAFAAFATGEKRLYPNPVKAIFQRILDALKRLGGFLRGHGWRTADDVFADLFSGKFRNNPGMRKMTMQRAMYAGYKGAPDALAGQFSGLADRKERLEIDDSTATFTWGSPNMLQPIGRSMDELGLTLGRMGTLRLSDIMQHPMLYQVYPELRNVYVNTAPMTATNGEINENSITLRENLLPTKAKKTLLHEIQHWIQAKEGFAKGGSPGMFYAPEFYRELNYSFAHNDEVKRLDKYAQQWLDKAFEQKDPAKRSEYNREAMKYNRQATEAAMYDAYRRLAGEIESRDTANRSDLNMLDRWHTQPYSSENIPLDEWVVKMKGGAAAEADATGALFRPNDAERTTFERGVADALAGKIREGEMVEVGSTPKVLQLLGAQPLPMQMNAGKIRLINRAEGTVPGAHGLTEEQIKQAIMQIHDPVMVMRSSSSSTGASPGVKSLVVVTELFDDKQRPIIAALHLSDKHGRNVINRIASYYGRNDAKNFFVKQIMAGNVVYRNTQKSSSWHMTAGLQLPGVRGAMKSFTNPSILTEQDVVKRFGNEQVMDSRYSLAERGREFSDRLQQLHDDGALVANLKQLFNPLDWSRFSANAEAMTPPAWSRAAAYLFRTPVHEAEADSRKAPFVQTGIDRETDRMDVKLRFMDYSGPGEHLTFWQRLKHWLTSWGNADPRTAWGVLQNRYLALTPEQRAAYDVMNVEGDINSRYYTTLQRANQNPRIRAAGVTPETFQFYKDVRKHMDEHVPRVRNQLFAQLYLEAAMQRSDVAESVTILNPTQRAQLDELLLEWTQQGKIYSEDERPEYVSREAWEAYSQLRTIVKPRYVQSIADARKRDAVLTGWMHRYHGEGEWAAKVYQVIDHLTFDVSDHSNGSRAILPYYPGQRLAGELTALGDLLHAENEDFTLIRKQNGRFIANGPAELVGRFVDQAQGLEIDNPETGRPDRVLTYVRYLSTEKQAKAHEAQVKADMKKAMPATYREGMAYETKTNETSGLNEAMYGDINDRALEAAQREAMKKALAKGELTKEEFDKLLDQIIWDTADVVLGRAAGKYQIRRADYLIEGYDRADTINLFTDYQTAIAGQFSKMLYSMRQSSHFRNADGPTQKWAYRYIDDSLRNQGAADRASGVARSIATFMYLGFKPASVLVNATQPWTLGVAMLGKVVKNPVKSMFQAQKDVFKNNLTRDEQEIFNSALWHVQEAETATMEAAGLTEGARGKVARTWQQIVNKALGPFQEVEMLNRKTTILAAYRAYRSADVAAGQLDVEAMDKALAMNRNVNFEMSRANLPGFARNPFGRTFYALQSFSFNTFNLVYNSVTSGEKADMVAMLRLAGMIALIGGAAAVPGGDEANKLYRRLFGKDLKLEAQTWMKRHAKEYGTPGEALYAFAWHGAGGVAGINLSNSLRVQVPFIAPLIDGESLPEAASGVFGGLTQKVKLAGKNFARGNVARGVENLAPEFIASPLRAYRQYDQGNTTTGGRPVFGPDGRQMRYTAGEAITRAMGLQPLAKSEAMEQEQVRRDVVKQWGDKRKELLDTLRVAKPEDRRSVMLKLMQFNRDVRKSQAWPNVSIIDSETIQRAFVTRPKKQVLGWFKAQTEQ